jgi:cobalt-zinc-cadmium efflux system outer membrane protein
MGRTLAVTVIAASSLAIPRPLHAADRLTLAHVLELVRANNPSIQAARARSDAAAELPVQARAWADPVVSWEAWNAPPPADIARADNNIFRLSQAIPFPGKRRIAGEQASHGAEASAADASSVELDALAAAGRDFWTLWVAHARVAVAEREYDLARRLAAVAEQRYATGEVPQPDVLEAQVELTHAITKIDTEKLALDSAQSDLLELLSERPDASLPEPEDPSLRPLAIDEARLLDLAFAHRPELAGQRATIAREESGIALAEKGYLPDFEVSVGRFINEHGSNGVGAMLSMTVPLAWKKKYDAGVSEASARRDAAVADQRRLEDTIRREVHHAVVTVRSALLRHALFASTHIPQAEQALRVTEAAYQTGAVDFPRVVEAVRADVDARLDHAEAGATLERAFVDLARAIGTDVPRGAAARHGEGG